jgi:hypothetical protein
MVVVLVLDDGGDLAGRLVRALVHHHMPIG